MVERCLLAQSWRHQLRSGRRRYYKQKKFQSGSIRIGLQKTEVKVFSQMKHHLGHLEKELSGPEKANTASSVSCQQWRILRPFTCGVASHPRVGTLTIVPENTATNKEWYQNDTNLQQQLCPTIQEQGGDEHFFFQHKLAPCHNAKVITKCLRDQNVEMRPWSSFT